MDFSTRFLQWLVPKTRLRLNPFTVAEKACIFRFCVAPRPSVYHGENKKEAERMSIRLPLMSNNDIPEGIHLKDIAGWNQTAVDWERFLLPVRMGVLWRNTGAESSAPRQP